MRLTVETISRFRRFVEYFDSIAIALAPLGLLAVAICLRPKYWLSYTAALIIGFIVFYPFRHDMIRRIGTPLATFLEKRLITGAIVICFALILVKQSTLGMVILLAGFGLSHGIIFWTRTDDMYVMITWLAFPTEYGRPPDYIELFGKKYVDWEGDRVLCHVYRFRYGEETSTGITRPVTFSFCDEMGSLSLDEVIEKYRSWHLDVGKKVIERDTKETE